MSGFNPYRHDRALSKTVPPEMLEAALPPMKRWADPSEIAGTVVFLCSPAASFLSGQAIAVDGAATVIDELKMILRLVNIGDAKSLACHLPLFWL